MKVLIRYKITIPGFFGVRQLDGSELIETGNLSIEDAIAADLKKQTQCAKQRNMGVSLWNFEVLKDK